LGRELGPTAPGIGPTAAHVRQDVEAHELLSKELQKTRFRKDRLVEAYLYEAKVDGSTYESQRTRLDGEIASLEEAVGNRAEAEIDVDECLANASALLTDLSGAWRQMDRLHRPQFARALFPAGMIYSDGTIGTADKP